MKSVFLFGCTFLATCLALYGASATTAPTPQPADRHAIKPFEGPVLAQPQITDQNREQCRLCHASAHPKK